MKIARQVSCTAWKLISLKQVRRISPIPPANAAIIDMTESTFCAMELFLTNLPLCLNHRSSRKTKLNETTVMVPPTMKSGCNLWAPMFEM